jgi:hypothetical protein
VRGGEVQRDRDERMDVLYVSCLDMDVRDDGGLVIIVQRSSVTGGGWGLRRQRRLDQGCRGMGLLGEDGRPLLLLEECGAARTWARVA